MPFDFIGPLCDCEICAIYSVIHHTLAIIFVFSHSNVMCTGTSVICTDKDIHVKICDGQYLLGMQIYDE